MEKNLKFHITITNNETGETLNDCDTATIIGAYATEGGVQCLGMTDSDPYTLAETVNGAKDIVKTIYTHHPAVGALADMLCTVRELCEDENEENEEDK